MSKLILLVKIPYIDNSSVKLRPVVQLNYVLDQYGNFQVAIISSKIENEKFSNSL